MEEPLIILWSVLVFSAMYALLAIGSAFMFEHLDLAYGYRPNEVLRGLRTLFWFFSLMLVGFIILATGRRVRKSDI